MSQSFCFFSPASVNLQGHVEAFFFFFFFNFSTNEAGWGSPWKWLFCCVNESCIVPYLAVFQPDRVWHWHKVIYKVFFFFFHEDEIHLASATIGYSQTSWLNVNATIWHLRSRLSLNRTSLPYVSVHSLSICAHWTEKSVSIVGTTLLRLAVLSVQLV